MRILSAACCWIILSLNLSAADWTDVTVPGAWRKVPSGDQAPIDGYSWYRTYVQIPAEWSESDLTLFVEALDDARSAWVNGTTVGVNGSFPPTFRSALGENGRFTVPSGVLKPGRINCVAIRVHQNDPRTNFNVAPPILYHSERQEAIRMNGTWQYRPGDDSQWASPVENEFSGQTQHVFVTVDKVTDLERYVTKREGDRDPLSPEDAEAAFEVAEDLQFQLVLSEPDIAQPLFMTWDQRGRMWVIEYRQYPEPAGLKMLSRDVYLRSVYDKVPLPPPHGDQGRDRISIHEDTDGDGVYDSHKTFVDGLNIASSVAIGRGGVFVTNPPYLLFYPDSDGDDVPDGDPEVLLEGFGLEDSHSVINSLVFGPDGWLYGGQGSTVSGVVKQPGSQAAPTRTQGQQIWRYHPEHRQFEVFAEGGGNTFGVEIDAAGRVYSGHNGGDTRGFHYVPGGYYRKGFAKHGALSNPYTFGFFEAMAHHKVPRFTHNFVLYHGTSLPEHYHGQLFGIEPLQGQVVLSDVQTDRSSFRTKDIDRVVKTDDPWFRPVDIRTGPEGAVYVADMYEQRIDHSSHYAGRIDRTNGRIYRLIPKAQTPPVTSEFGHTPAPELLRKQLTSADKWHRMTAVRLLGDQPGDAHHAPLLQQAQTSSGYAALSSVWGLHAAGGLNDRAAGLLLQHQEELVREWVVRLVADQGQVSDVLLPLLVELAAEDSSVHVRKQLAASARRLSAGQALPILAALYQRDEDAGDIHQPLMLWWAVESIAAAPDHRSQLLQTLLSQEDMWQRPLVKTHLLNQLMKRYILPGQRAEFLAAADLLRQAPNPSASQQLMSALETALEGRSLSEIPSQLLEAIAAAGGGSPALRLRQKQPQAVASALAAIQDGQQDLKTRSQFVEILGQIRLKRSVPVLIALLQEEQDTTLLETVVSALHAFSDPAIGPAVVKRVPSLPAAVIPSAVALLASRADWSLAALEAVSQEQLDRELLTAEALRKMLLHQDAQIQQRIEQEFGEIRGATTQEMQQETERLHQILAAGSGNPKQGKKYYMKNCGRCHRLHGEGGQVGPDLTSFKRDDVPRLLQNIVNPDLEIREGFENYLVVSADGRLATGFLASQDEQVVVLRSTEGVSHTFYRDEIDDMLAVPESVMPKGTLKELSDQQIRDLFAYLRSTQPVNY